MATIRKDIVTLATPAQAWDAVRDVGALHTRLVPGFVIDTKTEPGARVVTFANGVIVRELIVTLDEVRKRLVWTAESRANHALQQLRRSDLGRARPHACDLGVGFLA